MGFLAVILAALAGFGVGAAWYIALSKPWMEAAGIERAVLVGNSLGCQVVAEVAARRPR